MEPYKCFVCDEIVTDSTRCHDCGQGLIGERETVQQHEWERIRRFVSECPKCNCIAEPTGDREGTQYSFDNGKTWTEEEPPCIARKIQEDENKR